MLYSVLARDTERGRGQLCCIVFSRDTERGRGQLCCIYRERESEVSCVV